MEKKNSYIFFKHVWLFGKHIFLSFLLYFSLYVLYFASFTSEQNVHVVIFNYLILKYRCHCRA
ncbi:hypothetical protein BD408DRAFT_207544 [Parasitella parasitica]|nr:hypothetical protein BD408DRAFT_207544 [Parasitella parasitica]